MQRLYNCQILPWNMPRMCTLPQLHKTMTNGSDCLEQMFTPLVEKCKSLGRAMRIGTNHGSLSARILSYYGDTPRSVLMPVACAGCSPAIVYTSTCR